MNSQINWDPEEMRPCDQPKLSCFEPETRPPAVSRAQQSIVIHSPAQACGLV